MSAETLSEIARYLSENSFGKDSESERARYPKIDGVPYTFPGLDIETAPYNMVFPPEYFDMYHAMCELMVEESLPESWRQVIKESSELAKENGADQPVDLVMGTYSVLVKYADYAAQVGIELFEESDWYGPDFRDKEGVRRRIDAVINDENLRERLINLLAVHIPDRSAGWLEISDLAKVIKDKPGILVDIGCGVGYQTVEHKELMPDMVVAGVDRQYHPRWYEPWQDKTSGVTFIRADAMKGLPFRENSIDYATMEHVADHVTEKGLEKILTEARRVLKQGGILFVAPQANESGDGYWRAYNKTEDEDGNAVLQRAKLKELQL